MKFSIVQERKIKILKFRNEKQTFDKFYEPKQYFTHYFLFVINSTISLCGVKEFGHLGPFYTKPKAHIEEKETPENE